MYALRFGARTASLSEESLILQWLPNSFWRGRTAEASALRPQEMERYLLLSSTFSAPSFIFFADLCTTFLLAFLVALPVFFAASPVFFPASLTSWPASLISCFAL